VLVHRDQYETVVGHLRNAVGKLVVGRPTDPTTTHGPVVNRAQFERIQRYIDTGIRQGAALVCGGLGRPAGLQRGYYVRPTIFGDVTAEMTIAQDEIFGPVLVVMTYASEDEAIQIANGTQYGLGGYVFSRDPAKALEIGRQMRAGRIFYNGAPSDTAAPMGGYKKSGNGREMGVYGMEEYLEVKGLLGFS
jgi:aldehyde dehydrogenase (NAD+)